MKFEGIEKVEKTNPLVEAAEYIKVAEIDENLKSELLAVIKKYIEQDYTDSYYVVGEVADYCRKYLPNFSDIDDQWKLNQKWDSGLSQQQINTYVLFNDLRKFLNENLK